MCERSQGPGAGEAASPGRRHRTTSAIGGPRLLAAAWFIAGTATAAPPLLEGAAELSAGYDSNPAQSADGPGLGRAAAAIAHEVRNPLNAMAMGLQRLQLEAAELTPEHRRLVDLAQEAVRRTNGTVTGLLEYARALHPVPEPLRLAVLIGDALTLYRGRLAAAGIDLAEDLPPVANAFADPRLLSQVLDNLLRNALEAAPAASTLEVRAWSGTGTAAFSIANDGFTLPAAEAERCLEPWFTTKPTGTGLGLAISRRIIAAQGGSLHLSVPQAGRLCVTVELPCRPLVTTQNYEVK
jgi:two-component system, NtrC family, sensor histidine kinase HydH